MFNINRIESLKHDVKENILNTLLSEAKLIFDKHPSLTSFGWDQFTTRGGDRNTKKYSVYHTLNTPNVNGNLGTKIVGGEEILLQNEINEVMSKFDIEMLFIGFGDDCEIAIYRDLTYEVHPII